MKEIYEFRLNSDYAARLFEEWEGKDVGQLKKSVKVIRISRDDPRFDLIGKIDSEIRKRDKRAFFYSWSIERTYKKHELDAARIFHVRIRSIFEPAGEECGTEYDESVACEICGSNRKQLGPLRLEEKSIPKRDSACTIAGEVVVSQRLKDCFERYKLAGLAFDTVMSGGKHTKFFQPRINHPGLVLAEETIAGIDPFDYSETADGEVYKCERGHTIGLNLLSEVYVKADPIIAEFDFFSTEQKVGVKRGLLRPQPLYVCSKALWKMVLEEKLSGFTFEVAHVKA